MPSDLEAVVAGAAWTNEAYGTQRQLITIDDFTACITLSAPSLDEWAWWVKGSGMPLRDASGYVIGEVAAKTIALHFLAAAIYAKELRVI